MQVHFLPMVVCDSSYVAFIVLQVVYLLRTHLFVSIYMTRKAACGEAGGCGLRVLWNIPLSSKLTDGEMEKWLRT
jgi:hypothetical protein